VDDRVSAAGTQEKIISVTLAAEMLAVSSQTVLRLIESGEIVAHRYGARGWWKVRRSSVVDYQEKALQASGVEY
jgi:excisionase family DNA binding protein